MLKKLLLLVSWIIFLSSCSSTEEVSPTEPSGVFGIRDDLKLADYEKIATNVSPYQAGVNYPDFNAAVMLMMTTQKDESVGSGVLIAPNWVLTASHNVYVKGEDKTPKLPTQIKVLIGNDPNNPQATYSVERIEMHPTWQDGEGGFESGNDICLLKLTTNVTQVLPTTVNYSRATPVIGSMLWFAGFGDYSKTAGQDKNAYSKKHAYQNILDRKVDNIISKKNNLSYEGGLLAFDFDSPNGLFNTLGDAIMNTQEKVLGSGTSSSTALPFEATTVGGDSGGAIWAYIDGGWKVVGVLHGGVDDVAPNVKDASYGDISVFTNVASHEAWIKNTIK